ncbi:TonB-dependent receptor [Ketobacter sp.]|nr:MAG: TonB-dependent receptor [Ketobacter sp.]
MCELKKIRRGFPSTAASSPQPTMSFLAAAITTVIATGFTTQVNAEEPEQAERRGPIEEVTVTARRREESAQDVPIAVTVMNSDQLEKQNIVELESLGTKVPAVTISNTGTSSNAPIVAVRGQRPTDTTLSLDQSIPIYFNDVVMTPSQGTNLAFYDLANLQILKGPQGTLFGRNSTGGALLITPAKPTNEQEGYVQMKVGDYNLVGLEGAANMPISDNLQIRVAGRALQRDGYQEVVADNQLNGQDLWDEDSKGMRIGVNYETNSFANLFMVAYDENDMIARAPTISAFAPIQVGALTQVSYGTGVADAVTRQANRSAHDVEIDLLGREKVKNTFASNTTEFDISDDMTIKNIFGYRKVETSRTSDADGTAFPISSNGLSSRTSAVTLDPVGAEVIEAEQLSNELQLLGSTDKIEWITGVYWYQMEASQDGFTQVFSGNVGPFPALIYQSAPIGDVDNTAYGVFGEATYHFNDEWAATLGLRQSWDERSVTVRNQKQEPQNPALPFTLASDPLACAVTDVNGNPEPDCARTESETFSAPTGRASVSYTPDDATLIYGSISTGYRSGGFNLRGVDNVTLTPFEEENVITYEVGHKAEWGNFRTDVAAYVQQYDDIQKTVSVSTGSSFETSTINAATATIQGIELNAMWAVTDDLLLTLGYAYTDASYDEWDTEVRNATDPTLPAYVPHDASGNDFEFLPENTATVSASYTFPTAVETGDISLTASVYWQDEMVNFAIPSQFENTIADPTLRAAAYQSIEVDAYAVANLRIDWRAMLNSDFDSSLTFSNITDEEYVSGGFNQIDSLGLVESAYGPPRTIVASLRYNF